MPAKHRAHYAGDYQRRAAAVRRHAYADPDTVCWRCGLPLGDGTWDAGHLIDGNSASPLAAEHSACNRSAGAAMGNRRREPRSRQWV